MSAGDPLVGRVLSGTYRVEARLGAGGMGAVYAARHARTGKAYAVKVLLPELAARTHALGRFRREAHALAALGHPHIVAIHDFDQTPEGIAFLVMERLEGEDLASRLRRGPVPLDAALAITDQVASALEAAHGIGLVHRDLKPANVFLARVPGIGERAVLLDFGLAKSLEEAPAGGLTSTGVVMGTPHYMSPEQAQGATLDARTDLWSLAVILHEMLSGRPPFEGATMASLFVQILTQPTPSLRARGVMVSDALEALLQRALAKTPADRFAGVTDFRRALHALASGPVLAVPPTSAIAPATRESPAMGVGMAATPRGNPFATTGTGRDPVSGPARLPWLALAAGLVLAGLGAGAGAAGWLFFSRARDVAEDTASAPEVATAPDGAATSSAAPTELQPAARAAEPSDAEPSDAEPSDAEPSDAEPSSVRSAAVQPTDPPASAAGGSTVTSGARGRTSARRAARADPVAAQPASSGEPIPPGFDTSAPGAAERIAARPYISSGDWPGCVRVLHGAPPTREVLWDRASCAFQARDRATLESACGALDQRFPGSAPARGCQGLLSAMAYQ